MMSKYILLLLLPLTLTVQAEIFEKKEQGVTVFTDSPAQGVTKVTLPKTSGFQATNPKRQAPKVVEDQQKLELKNLMSRLL